MQTFQYKNIYKHNWNVFFKKKYLVKQSKVLRVYFYLSFLKLVLIKHWKFLNLFLDILPYFYLIQFINYHDKYQETSKTILYKDFYKKRFFQRPTTNVKWKYNLPSYYRLFVLFLEYSQSSFTFYYTPHFKYKLLFNIAVYDSLLKIDLNWFLKKWVSSLLLFSNFTYFNIKSYSLGNKLLTTEVLALNYKTLLTKIFFINKIFSTWFIGNVKWHEMVWMMLTRIKKNYFSNVFIWDLKQHNKNLFYLKRLHYFVVGLTPLHTDPWDVHYFIPVFSASLLIQYYFINLYVYIVSYTKQLYFYELKKNWYLLYL